MYSVLTLTLTSNNSKIKAMCAFLLSVGSVEIFKISFLRKRRRHYFLKEQESLKSEYFWQKKANN